MLGEKKSEPNACAELDQEGESAGCPVGPAGHTLYNSHYNEVGTASQSCAQFNLHIHKLENCLEKALRLVF